MMVGRSWSSAFKTELRSAKMEKLKRNHARFCAKYVKFFGVGYSQRNMGCQSLIVNGKKFGCRLKHGDFKVGDVVYIAKRIPTLRSQESKWEIHQIELPEAYWWYENYEAYSPKEKRTNPYNPHPETWFGPQSYIVEKL